MESPLHSLEPEIEALRTAASGAGAATGAGGHDGGTARTGVDFDRLARLESGRFFPLHRELLIALYGSVAALLAGVGLLLRNNLDRIGPVTLVVALLASAAVCYATALHTRRRGAERSTGGDYVLLLGALLLSAAVGYGELRFQWFGQGWSRHLLWLAVAHALTAYALGSKLVLAVALGSFAGWLGIEASLGNLWAPQQALPGLGWRALACAAVFGAAGVLHRRLRGRPDFPEVFAHFAANFGFWGALALLFDVPTRWIGAALLAAFALYVGRRGLRRGREIFVLYAIGYATLGLTWLEATLIDERLLQSLVVLLTLVAAVMLLWRLRAQLQASRA